MNTTMDARSVDQLSACIANGMQPEFLFFWGHRPSKDGSITKSCFSQWYEAPFKHDGTSYRTAEHFMMAAKARLFDDDAIRDRVLAAASPGEAKQLGRRVKHFDEDVWQRERFGIVVAANQAKFSQHPAFRRFLLQTGQRVLVEASPVDAVWGIGLAADHADAPHPQRWRGLNLLGFALMEVRSRLAAG